MPLPTLRPLPPLKALAYFRGLVPTPGFLDPGRWSDDLHRAAFTLAASTDAEVLDRVQSALANILASGEASQGQQLVGRILDDAFRQDWGQANYDFWGNLQGIVSLSPAINETLSQTMNSGFGGRPFVGTALPEKQQLTERGIHAAEQIAPVRQGADILAGKPGAAWGLLGPNVPDTAAINRARRPPPKRVIRGQQKQYQHELKRFGVQ